LECGNSLVRRSCSVGWIAAGTNKLVRSIFGIVAIHLPAGRQGRHLVPMNWHIPISGSSQFIATDADESTHSEDWIAGIHSG